MNGVRLMRFIDTTIGSVLCRILSVFRRKNNISGHAKKILLVKFFGFGNIMMVSPAFRQLKQRFPDAELVFLTLKGNRKLLEAYKSISRIIDIDISNPLLLPFGVLSAIWRLRKEGIDIAIDFEQYSRTSAILSFLSGRKIGVGFDIPGNPRCLLYDETVPCSDNDHILTQFQKLLGKTGVELGKVTLEKIEHSAADERVVEEMLEGINKKLIVLHVGNGPNAPEKRWEIKKFAELAERLARRGLQIAVIGSGQDRREVSAFSALVAGKIKYLDFLEKLSIPQLTYLMTKASAYVSADTGPAHLAAAMEVPAVILYGPSSPKAYGAWGNNVHYMYKSLWCSPCGTNKNSHDYKCINKEYQKCMKDISVEEVEGKLTEIMR